MQRRLFLKIFIFFNAALFLSITCFAEDFSTVLGENLSSLGFEDAKQKAAELAEYLNFSSIIDFLLGHLASFFQKSYKSFGFCVCLILCFGVLSTVNQSFSTKNQYFLTIGNLLFIAAAFYPLSICFTKVYNHLTAVCSYMLAFIPVEAALLSASGNTISSGVTALGTQVSISALQLISCAVIFPCTKAIAALYTVNSFCKDTSLDGVCSFLKTASLWILGLSFTLFTGILSLQTAIASAADNLALKGIKYGVVKLIPIAGGMLGDSMRTVITSVSFIKSTSGVGAIIFLIYSLIPPICAIMITKLFFSLIGALSSCVGEGRFCSLCSSLNSTLHILMALMLSISVSFIIMLTLFIKTTVSL